MSNKSGVSSQAITLPSGGGAVAGIGETFSPDLFTGTGNVSIPLRLPSGRNGFQPELALGYSSGNGNGPFGFGWTISVPGITRKTSAGVPRYRDRSADPRERDTFILSGAEDLVAIDESVTGVTRFQPRVEGLFARIERVTTPGEDFWRVSSKDGLVSVFGTASESGEPVVVANPAARREIFRWPLTETTDSCGNRIVYDYRRDRGDASSHVWDQLYLERIRYVDYERDGEVRFLATVTLVYDERPDPFSEYRAGFEIRTRLRCTRIEVRTDADAERLARVYELVYVDDRVRTGELPAASLPLNGASLLSEVRLVGVDGDDTERLPPLSFEYTRFAPEKRRFRPITAVDNALPARSLADADIEMVDLFGNGLPDLVEINGSGQFWRNLGNGRFDRPRSMPEVPAGVRLADPGVQFVDMNGDGRADLLVLEQRGYFPHSFAGRWSRQGFVEYEATPAVSFADADVRLFDLDGDGVVDALRTGAAFELFFNDPRRGWDRVETRPRRPLAEFPDLSFTDPRVHLADVTGDGLQDLVLVEQGRIDYWPYLAHGRWGRRVTMANSPVFRDAIPAPGGGFEPKRVLFGDLDGDGLDDIVYLDGQRITFWINQGGNQWSEPTTIDATPAFADVDAVRLADMLGTGVAGVLWTIDRTAGADNHYQFLDLTGGAKPYLLAQMDNHMGAVTRVAYASSTQFYLDDVDDPKTRWATPLPFPVQVLERVEVVDALSGGKLTTKYRYHHGYWDGGEREFRGFGRVERLDTESFAEFHAPGLDEGAFAAVDAARFAPPLLTKTWFHLGPVGDEFAARVEADLDGEYWSGDRSALARPAATRQLLQTLPASQRGDAFRSLRGQVLRTEQFALDGSARADRPFTVTESQYGIREESPPANGDPRRRIFFPHAVAQRTTEWERGDDPRTRFIFFDDHDRYGQPRRQIDLAVPRGRDYRVAAAPGAPYLAVLVETEFAQKDDATKYLVDRVCAASGFEIVNDGSQSVFDLCAAVQAGAAARSLFSQTFSYYDGKAFEGLPLGAIGDAGALVRSESLVLTDEILRAAYAGEGTLPIPGFLQAGTVSLPAEYPPGFLALPQLAGYVFADGSDHRARGYFAQTTRVALDFQTPGLPLRGLRVAIRNPLGHETATTHDQPFHLLPIQITDPVGLTVQAEHDYRLLQPRVVTDPNGNRSSVTFSPLGLVTTTASMGKPGEAVGDTLSAPGSRLDYDYFAFAERRQPVSVRTTLREHHATDQDVPPADRDKTIVRVDYFDGFGRPLQTRTQTDDVLFGAGSTSLPANEVLAVSQDDAAGTSAPIVGRSPAEGPNVVVSGWQVYDNKGRVLEKFEPQFSQGFAYRSPQDLTGEEALGRRVRLFYDALGRVNRQVDADRSEQRAVRGVPDDLADPDRFTPSPWELFSYDANDLAPLSEADAASVPAAHHTTPSSVVFDALGRAVETLARNGRQPADRCRMRSTYDIRGNVTAIVDALDRVAFSHTYDLADRAWRSESIDAGVQRLVLDAAGSEIERRDGKGALTLHAYDRRCRLARQWARDDAGGPVTLRQRLEYGDAGDPQQPAPARQAMRSRNLLGRLHRHHDEAGLTTIAAMDFSGSVREKSRLVMADAPILAAFDRDAAAFQVDWEPALSTTLADRERELLEPTPYETTLAYDALSRVTRLRLPADIEGHRSELRAQYNRAGALAHLRLDEELFVERIAYDARGQRAFIAYGNAVMTRYAFDPRSCRLRRQRSERFEKTGDVTYTPRGAALEDCAFDYDLVGNVVFTSDRTPGSGIVNNPEAASVADAALAQLLASGNALHRRFAYDPLYRLLSATGREFEGPSGQLPFDDPVRGRDLTKAVAYVEEYGYDAMNNLLRLAHRSGPAGFTRQFGLAGGSNRLRQVKVGDDTVSYVFDASGNMRTETTSRHFDWTHRQQMHGFRIQAEGAAPSIQAQYLYDSAGQRVKKLVRRQGGRVDVTHSIGGSFEHHRVSGGGASGENNHLHVLDDRRRIAVVRVGEPSPDDRLPAVRFHLGDHIGSTSIVVDSSGALVGREEFTPFGETSFGTVARQRFRFRGRERDEESGLSYCGARYYAPGLARWTSADPAGSAGGANLFAYVLNNPLRLDDPQGTEPVGLPEDPEHPGFYTAPGETIVVHGTVDRMANFKDIGLANYDEYEEWQRKEYYRARYHPSGIVPAGGYDWEKPPKDEYSESEEFRNDYPEEAFKAYESSLGDWDAKQKASKQAYAGYRAGKSQALEKNLRMMDTWGEVGEVIGWVTVGAVAAFGAATLAIPAGGTAGSLSLGGGSSAAGGGVVNIGAQTASAASESGAILQQGVSGVVRGGAGRVASGEVVGGGGVFSSTAAEAGLADTAVSAQTAATVARAEAADVWLAEMLQATSATRTVFSLEQQSEALRILFHMRNSFLR